jgi:HprK-related kinase A
MLLPCGPFSVRLASGIGAFRDEVAMLYRGYPAPADTGFADFHIAIAPPRGLRRWVRPQVDFRFDGESVFKPMPLDQALYLFEWGVNYVVTTTANTFLVVHAASIEKNGRAVIMPGTPGAGKSTLCAGLAYRGWRLMTDELTLVSLADVCITPVARPISLKNASIELIRGFVPGAILSRPASDTVKGTVALLKAPDESVARLAEPAVPAWVVFPRYRAGAATSFAARRKAETLIELAHNSFNYQVHGAAGFDALARIVDRSDCYDFVYGGDLDAAVAAFDALAAG